MFTTTNKKVIVSVINDLVTDQRVQRTCLVLQESGYDVFLVGRKLKTSPPMNQLPFKTRRMNLLFTSGPLFYFFFQLRLFFLLLFTKADLLFSNDLDTLLPNYWVSKLKGIPLVYDSHEIFCEVPELKNTPFKKRIWERLERSIVPKLKNCITVNQSIAGYFKEKYKVHFSVVRNIPQQVNDLSPKTKRELNLPETEKIVLYQGAGINIDRGAEELVMAMKDLENIFLLIIGGGDVFEKLKKIRVELKLEEKIKIIDKISKTELLNYTRHADLGMSIDKDTNLNYHFSLPNKIFDYMQAGVPVLSSNLPELKRLIDTYQIGNIIENHEPAHIAKKIKETLNSASYAQWKMNTKKAADENSWQQEKLKLLAVLNGIK